MTVVVEVPLLPHPAITQPTTIRSANELFLITQELIWLRRMISTPARSLRNKSHSRNPTAIHDQSPVKDEAPIHAVTPSKGPNSGVLQRCLRDQPRPPQHTTNWVPVPQFEPRPSTCITSSARRADPTFDVAHRADQGVLSPAAFEDRWRDLIGACKSPTQFCPPSIRDRGPFPG